MRKPARKPAPTETGDDAPPLVAQWPLSPFATLGSSVRAKGIERELIGRQSRAIARCIRAELGQVTLEMPQSEVATFVRLSKRIEKRLADIEDLPVLPREAEDVLTISTRERHKWLADGRLKSAGTRTVKLRGRARAVTFHVFDPSHIEDVLDRDLPSLWREDDLIAAAENRRRAAHKAASTRAGKKPPAAKGKASRAKPDQTLDGWDAFDADGLLR
jgi:hypothetical protein